MGCGASPQGAWIPLERVECVGEQTRSQVTVIKCQVNECYRQPQQGIWEEGAERVTGL